MGAAPGHSPNLPAKTYSVCVTDLLANNQQKTVAPSQSTQTTHPDTLLLPDRTSTYPHPLIPPYEVALATRQ